MASNAVVVPENPKGEGKPKNVQQEARNRRVLRDIGNLVIVPPAGDAGKPKNQITRAGTRSFCTQRPENSQAAADKNNCKKPNLLKKELKPKNDSVIREASLKKPVKSLTTVLSARSKAACSISNRLKDLTLDIDAADAGNELAAVEYVEDMYNYYKLTEDDGRVHDYMDSQPEINSKMRAILVDWLIDVHRKFELMPESLYLTINIVDRFLSIKSVPRRELQLAGISSMLIACKYEEIWAPEVSDFMAISDNAYVREEILVMEKTILGVLGWYLTVPTPYVFLVRYIKAAADEEEEMENMTFFLVELGLMDYSIIVKFSPSMLAAAAVYAARSSLGRSPPWTEMLKHYTGYSEDDLMECVKALVSLHAGASENKLKAVSRKYSSPSKGVVALFAAAGPDSLKAEEKKLKGI